MMPLSDYTIDPKLDLVLERVVDVPRELVWKAWTTPELLKQWFCPRPWKTTECEIDLRPGGVFRTVAQSPEGEGFGGTGCYLEVVENEKLVWTDAMLPGYRPATEKGGCLDSFFTAILLLETTGDGTRYTVIARHAAEEHKRAHEERGFEHGWGTALEQLVEMVKSWR